MQENKKIAQEKEIEIPVSYEKKKNDREEELDQSEGNVDYKALAEEYLDHLQRLQSEFSNYKKRVDKEREELFSTAKGELVLKLLPVLDDLERMLDHYEEYGECNCDAVKLIYQNLVKILTDEGLEKIAAVGEQFDPEFHEAVGVEETDSEQEDLVLEEWQKGYLFGGKLLRPSRVKVGKSKKVGDV